MLKSFLQNTMTSSILTKFSPTITLNSNFHTSSISAATRLPLLKRLTRRATLRHLKSIKLEKEKHGDKFKFLEKHRRYPGLPGYIPPVPPTPRLTGFVVGSEKLVQNKRSKEIVQRDLSQLKGIIPGDFHQSYYASKTKKNEGIIPPIVQSSAPLIPGTVIPEGLSLPSVQTEGPFYQYGITPSEVEFILKLLPEAYAENESDKELIADQIEAVRRIIALENASSKALKKFDRERVRNLLQRSPTDIGSPEIQIGVFTVRINSMLEHLKTNKKDSLVKKKLQKWESKRLKMLKYLKRTDLEKFVGTCKVVGIDPDSVLAL